MSERKFHPEDALEDFLNLNDDALREEMQYWGMTSTELTAFILKEGLTAVENMRRIGEAVDRQMEARE